MLRKLLLVAALSVVGTAVANAQELTPNPIASFHRLSRPIVNREGDIHYYVSISANDQKRVYWSRVPQGIALSPVIIEAPVGTFSRTRKVVQNGWKYSIDANTGTVAVAQPLTEVQASQPAAPMPMDVTPASNVVRP